MLKLKFGGVVIPTDPRPLDELSQVLSDRDFCYATLNKVSRSFAIVIQQLPTVLKDPICVFYLILRGLDSVEDDMTYSNDKKLPLLQEFYLKLSDSNWYINGVGDSDDYRILLAHFNKVIRVYLTLPIESQRIISDITRRMGSGMAEYATKTGSIDTITSYNLYCHYVAGLVGDGLSQLFSESGLESNDLRFQQRISNSMGLLLQKTNIIRDYLEDLEAGRTWWPQEIWSNYATKLSDFSYEPNSLTSLACLNHLVCDALSHLPDVLDYLSRLQNQEIFEFCAIPQVMAVATLAEVYSNQNVFKKNVKIRKGLTARLMFESKNLSQVIKSITTFMKQIEKKIPKTTLVNGTIRTNDTDQNEINNYSHNINNVTDSNNSNPHSSNSNSNSNSTAPHQLSPSDSSVLKVSTNRVKELLKQITSLCNTTSKRIQSQPQSQPQQQQLKQGIGIRSHRSRPNSSSSSSSSSPSYSISLFRFCNLIACLSFFLCGLYLLFRFRSAGAGGEQFSFSLSSLHSHSSSDLAAGLTCFLSVGYLFGFAGVAQVPN